MRLSKALLVLVLFVALVGGCGQKPTPTAIPPTQEVNVTPAISSDGGATSGGAGGAGLPTPGPALRLSQGTEEPTMPTASTPVAAEPLPEPALQQALARLPALTPLAQDRQVFALPSTSLAAPRAGITVQEAFPPKATAAPPDPAEQGPLAVLRYAPDGAVSLAPYLSVTFNQPMVALTGLADLAELASPVTLSPMPAGAWRWVGAKALLFEPRAAAGAGSGRFPMATTYTASVPAGVKSANGQTLAQTIVWTFTTPPPQMQSYYPGDGPQRRDVLMFVAFDQQVDPAAVLKTITVKAGSAPVGLRLATTAEVEADKAVRSLSEQAGAGRWLAFRATEELPADTAVNVTIGPGTPSAEGPLKTESSQSFGFRTYGPLRVSGQQCGYEKECRPLAPWTINFTNPLDEAAFTASQVQIEPALPGAQITANYSTITVQGQSAGRTTYKVRLSGELRDQFGQTLGQAQTVTFNVGSARPAMSAPGGNFIVLDPTGKPVYSVYTINYERLKVQAYAVQPEDWPAFQSYLRDSAQDKSAATPPGRRVISKTINIESAADQLVETAIDLGPALKDGLGHLILIVEPNSASLSSLLRPGQRPPVVQAWVQSTRIGLDAFSDAGRMVAWTNSLGDGTPLEGVSLTLAPAGVAATTDARGTADLALPSGNAASLLVARKGADVAFLPHSNYFWDESGWQRWRPEDTLRWYVFDDRQMYRPGEEAHIKGWVRRIGAGPAGDVGPLGGTVEQVTYQLRDARGNQITTGSAPVNALCGFNFAFKLTETMNLGEAYVELSLDGPSDIRERQYTHVLQVQEFRRPEFEVKATAGDGPFFANEHATVSVSANYYAGGGLPNADVTWQVSSSAGHYSPPGWDDFIFGTWIPWWRSPILSEKGFGRPGPGRNQTEVETFTGRTDAAGVHRLRLDFGVTTPPSPVVYNAETTVMDVNRQAWASSANLLVHPASLYVGLRSERLFVQKGQPLDIEAIVVDLDGKPAAGTQISLRAARMAWTYKQGTWQEEEISVQNCQVQSEARPVACTFETAEGGTYRITATIMDERERQNQSQFDRWVTGGQRPPARQVEQEEVTLIPDRKEYQPGDTAEILVQAPFYPAEGIVTLRRSGLVSEERFIMDGPSYTLRVPIDEAFIPNLIVQVDLVGAATRSDDAGQPRADLPKRPAFATGQLELSVPPLARTLALEVTPRQAKLEPGGETSVDIVVRDANGKPVTGAEVALVVVDEAVLALSNYKLADIVQAFYSPRSADVSDYHLRSSIVLANPQDLEAAQEMTQGLGAAATNAPMPAAAPQLEKSMRESAADEGGRGSAANAPIAVRSDFNPLATFAAETPTDAQGRATVEVKLPDNLTRYRVMAVAVAGGKEFGQNESSITARLPLMVRPSAPRFLNFGDRFELPVVVQNQTDAPLLVDVVVRGSNIAFLPSRPELSSLAENAGKRVSVPANDRVEVRFPALTQSAGIARFQVGAIAGQWADAAQFELPVWTPATTEAFATYGVIDQGAIVQPVSAPKGVFPQFGGLDITTSSTALQELTDAVLYLTSYPFECSEQLASRILAVAALRDVLSEFKAEGLPAPAQIEAAVARDIERLRGMQNEDGGFPTWRKGYESWPYHSIHVAHALQRAKMKDYAVPAEMLAQAQGYLRDIEKHIPDDYGVDARRALIAYALNVRKLMGDSDPARARALIKEAGLEKLSPEAIGWLLPVLSGDAASSAEVAGIRRHLNNRVTETAGAAHFVTSYGDDAYLLLHSDRRADGILLDALIGDQPQNDLIPKLVRGLLAQRKAGRWMNTQENAFVLLALDRYFNTYETQTPDFVARVWLGEQYAGESAFRGRTTEYRQISIPMEYLAAQPGTQDLLLSKEGQGRLYYRLGLRYAPTDLTLPAAEYGFTVLRKYEGVDDVADVRKDADGVWHVRAGARVRVTLTMVAPARRYHVALVDPLPAGFEAVNPALAVSGSVPRDAGGAAPYGWWWWRTWYEHQNMRDERVEAFASLLWDGVYTYTYVARATTPGRFVAPPAKAEEMYAPETFGRSATDMVVVE